MSTGHAARSLLSNSPCKDIPSQLRFSRDPHRAGDSSDYQCQGYAGHFKARSGACPYLLSILHNSLGSVTMETGKLPSGSDRKLQFYSTYESGNWNTNPAQTEHKPKSSPKALGKKIKSSNSSKATAGSSAVGVSGPTVLRASGPLKPLVLT